MTADVTTTFDERFGDADSPTPWAAALEVLRTAEIYWITTVRADGRPHVTPLIAVWDGDALYVTTGPDEQKAVNLRQCAHVAVTTGTNEYSRGLDVVLEADAVRVTDTDRLAELAGAWVDKYGEEWRFEVDDDAFTHRDHNRAWVFELSPSTAFGFAKGGPFGQTRYRFAR